MKKEQTVIIRKALLSDAAGLGVLSGELGYPATTAEMEHRIGLLVSAPHQHAVFIAERESMLGWIHVSAVESLESSLFAEIRGLVVTETHRGTGIGTRLVEEAEKWANEKKCPRIRVRTNVARAEAHAFYRKLGYAAKKTQDVFDKTLATA